MSLLGRPWALHDVEDVERLVRTALDDGLRARGAHLRVHQYDDALAFLLGAAWEISERWEPGRGGVAFATFLYRTIRLRLVDWWRAEFGRSKWQFSNGAHVRERPVIYSIERETGVSGGDPRHNTAASSDIVTGELARAYAEKSSDPATDRCPDLSRLLTGGSRQLVRDLAELGLETPKRAA
jgi:hypothetical protein